MLFVSCSVLAGLGKYTEHLGLFKDWIGLYNNSLLMIGGAIGLLLFALSFHFQSKFVNVVAVSTLAIYLGHEHAYVRPHLYNYIISLQIKYLNTNLVLHDTLGRICLAIGCSLIICIFFLMFDKMRLLLMKPVWKIYDKIEPRIIRLISRV